MLEWKKNSAKQKLVVKLFGSFNCYLTVWEMKKLKCSVNIRKCSHILLMISGSIISELSNSSCDQAAPNRTKQQLVLKVLYLLAVWMPLLFFSFFFLIQMKISACSANFLITFLSIIIFTQNIIFKKTQNSGCTYTNGCKHMQFLQRAQAKQTSHLQLDKDKKVPVFQETSLTPVTPFLSPQSEDLAGVFHLQLLKQDIFLSSSSTTTNMFNSGWFFLAVVVIYIFILPLSQLGILLY